MITIGLTGGIGTGKSTASKYLKEKGCIILDADHISRQMTEKGAPALVKIGEIFGNDLIDAHGNLDRKGLGNIVFKDKEKLKILESIITEKVVEYINQELITYQKDECDKIIIIDAPLLFECNMENMADENWLVTADLEGRIKRVMERDGLTREEIISRINNQMSDQDKMKLSHCILDNSKDLNYLYAQIDNNLERVKNEL